MFSLALMMLSFAAGFAACKYWPQEKAAIETEVQKVEDKIKG